MKNTTKLNSQSLDFLNKSPIITKYKCNCLDKLTKILNIHKSMSKSLDNDLECLRISQLIDDYKKYINE